MIAPLPRSPQTDWDKCNKPGIRAKELRSQPGEKNWQAHMALKKNSDATPGAKLLKLFRRLLVNGRKHYLQELAEWLVCSPQTVLRLAAEIEREIGTHLETGQDRRKRWYRIRPRTVHLSGVDCEEIRYLTLCRELAAPYLPEQVKQRIDESISSLSLTLLDPAVTGINNSAYAFFSKGRIDYTPHFEQLAILEKAITEKRICRVIYRAAGKEQAREHCLVPLRLISMNNALYLIGVSLEEDLRTIHHHITMAIHRIREVRQTTMCSTCELPVDTGENFFGLPWHEPRTFYIKFTQGKVSDYVRERIWSNSQVIHELSDHSVLLEITTRSQQELMAWTRSFGPDAELLSQDDAQALLSLQ